MRKYDFKLMPAFCGIQVFDNTEADAAAKAAADVAATKTAANTPIDDIDPEDLNTEKYKGRQFSTEEVNKIMQKRLVKQATKAQETINELTELKKVVGLTEQQKSQLQARIDDLTKDVMSKEQMAKERLLKVEKEKEEVTIKLSAERDEWRNRFTESLLHRTLLDASHKEGAFNDEHLIALLKPSAKVVEELDENQKPTGNFIVKVAQEVVQDGKKSVISLSAVDAVKRMKEDVDRYGNLFKENLKGGTGLNNTGSTKQADLSKISSFQEYQKVREQVKKL